MIYLDNAATTKPSMAVVEAVNASMTAGFFNPSALYKPAVEASKLVDGCRKLIMDKVKADQLVFTSGGTEANNLAIMGFIARQRKGGRVLYSQAEHASVKAACQALPDHFVSEGIPLNADGRINLSAFEEMIKPDTLLVCLMQVNNETGAIQPLEKAAQLIKAKCPGAWLHVDGVQGFLRRPMNMRLLGIDSYAMSGHKVHAPKGIGALALSGKNAILPRVVGGGQEAGLRSGTENTPGIAGLMAAVEQYPSEHQMRALKIALYEKLRNAIPGLIVNGPAPDSPDAADHIINLSFPPVRAETMLHALEAREVYVSQGSACSAKKRKHSETLSAMGASVPALESALRFSLSPFTTMADIETAVEACVETYQALKSFTRR